MVFSFTIYHNIWVLYSYFFVLSLEKNESPCNPQLSFINYGRLPATTNFANKVYILYFGTFQDKNLLSNIDHEFEICNT